MSVNSGFRKRFAEHLKRVGDKAELVVRMTALDLLSGMVKMSPVGDPTTWKGPAPEGYSGGQFKGNWQVGIGNINSVRTSPKDKDGSGAIGRGKTIIDTFKAGQKIYITNSMPYAKRLEYEGWSQQAPKGMVRVTIRRFDIALRQAAREAKGL